MSLKEEPTKVRCCTACDHPVNETMVCIGCLSGKERTFWCAFCCAYRETHWRVC